MASQRSLGVLSIDLVAKVGGFEQGLSKAERELDKRAKRMNDIAKKIGVGIGTAITAGIAGAAAAATGLALLTKQAINNADAMRDMSIRLGTSTETLSAFAYAASQTGTDIDTLGRGLKVLAKNAADSLNPTSEQAKVFAALGVNVTDATGKMKDLSQLVPEIANKFKLLEDGTTKAALAQALFGKAGLDLTEFLNQGADGLGEFTDKARKLGLVIDSETAAAADDFNDTLGDIKAIVSGVGLGIAKDLLPSLNQAAAEFRDMARDGDLARNMADVLNGVLKVGTGLLSGYAKAVNYLSVQIEVLANSLDGLREINNNLGLGGLFKDGSVAGGLAKIKAAAEAGTAELARLNAPTPFGVEVLSTTSKPGTGKFANVNKTADQAQIDALEKALATALSNPTATKGGSGAKGDAAKAAREAEAAIRALTRADEELYAASLEVVEAQSQAMLQWVDITAQLDGPLKVAEVEHIKRLQEIEQVGKAAGATAEQIAAAKAKETDAYNATTEAIRAQAEAMANEDLIRGMDSFRNVAYDFLVDLPKEGRNAWKSFLDDLTDMLTRWAANGVIDQLFGKQGTTGQGTAGGGWINSIIGAFGSTGSSQGSIFDLFSGAWGFANGGTMDPYSVARVNERGFEMASVNGMDYMLTGSKPVQITPNHMLGGKQVTITNNMTVQGRIDNRTSAQISQEIGMKVRMATARNG